MGNGRKTTKKKRKKRKGFTAHGIYSPTQPHLCFQIWRVRTQTLTYKDNHRLPHSHTCLQPPPKPETLKLNKIKERKGKKKHPFSYDPVLLLLLITQTEMALQNVHNKEMSLVLSSDAKPRLKWTPELHQRFIDAVNQLGGAEKATPKSLMRIMGIHGLTLYHLKSHLQKYRLGRSQLHPQSCNQNNKQEGNEEGQRNYFTSKICDGTEEQINDTVQVAHALQMHMEVQRKLHEQIEVQRRLQVRIEAQGKYLQSVLKKAQETLSGFGSCSIEAERAKAQLSQLVSMVDSGCPSSSFSALTESDGPMLTDARNKMFGHNGYSLESSLTTSESSENKGETQSDGIGKTIKGKRNSVVLSLMEMHSGENGESGNQTRDGKKRKNTMDDDNLEQSSSRPLKNIDLNCKSMNELDSSGPNMIDLNFNGVELFNGNY